MCYFFALIRLLTIDRDKSDEMNDPIAEIGGAINECAGGLSTAPTCCESWSETDTLQRRTRS